MSQGVVNQRRVVTLLRWVMFLALAYLTLASGEQPSMLGLGLLCVVAGTNVLLSRLPIRYWENPALLPIVAGLDIAVLVISVLWGQGFARDFFFAYFVLLAVVALAGSLRLAVVGTALVVTGYGAILGLEHGIVLLQSPELIGRLGFLFSVGVGYGGLMDASKARLRESALQGQLVGWVSKLSAAFSDDFDAVEVLRQILVDVQNMYPGNVRASLVQLEQDRIKVITSSDDRQLHEQPLDRARYPELTRVIEHGESIAIDDIRTSEITESVRDLVDELPFHSLLLCPVFLKEPGIGHVILRVARRNGTFSPRIIATTEKVAEAIGVIYRQAKMRESMERSEKMEMVSQITNSVAHSFNGILSTVLLSAQHLRNETEHHAASAACNASPCNEGSMERFDAIELATTEGLTIVERLAAWTRVGSDSPAALGNSAVEARALLDEVWKYARPHWVRRGSTRDLELKLDVDKELTVRGQSAELREVLLNLVINAVDAMPKGGTMTIAAKRRDDQVVFTVEDTGVGISEENVERIFDPLFTTKGTAGTGLGLTIARSVAQRHGGTLDVESWEGAGSRFTLVLPFANPDLRTVEESTEGSAADLAGDHSRVLLVEPSELVRDVMMRVLQSSGLEVDVVTSLEEASVMLHTARAYSGLIVDAATAHEHVGTFLEELPKIAPSVQGRVLLYANHGLPADLRELQQIHGFGFVDRSAGLAALRDALTALGESDDVAA